MYDRSTKIQHGGTSARGILFTRVGREFTKLLVKTAGHTTLFYVQEEAFGGAAALEKCRNMYKLTQIHNYSERQSVLTYGQRLRVGLNRVWRG